MSLNPDKLDQETIERQIVTHACGLHYLPAPPQPESGHGHLLIEHVDIILNHLAIAGLLFLDLGSVLDEATRHALARCNVVLVVVEPNRLCLMLAKTMLDEIQALASPPADLRAVLVEHSEGDTEYSRAQLEIFLGRKPAHTIKPAPALARQAVEQGTPVVSMQPESALAKQLYDLSQELLV
jgi:Flp pilus assembly CpaE family ATPase